MSVMAVTVAMRATTVTWNNLVMALVDPQNGGHLHHVQRIDQYVYEVFTDKIIKLNCLIIKLYTSRSKIISDGI